MILLVTKTELHIELLIAMNVMLIPSWLQPMFSSVHCALVSYLSMVITGKCIQERSASGAGLMQRLPVVIQRNPYTVNLSSSLSLN